MFLGRVLSRRVGRKAAVIEQVVQAVFHQGAIHPVGEGDDVGRLGGIHGLAAEATQIMGPTAGADDKHAFGTQGREGSTEGDGADKMR